MTLAGTLAEQQPAPEPLRLDFGCGKNKREGFQGCDRLSFEGVDHVFDIGKERWPFEDASVTEAHASHFVEHLTQIERVHFVNELHRVLIPGGTCMIIVPHWASNRAYGDPTHQWPPVAESWFWYLSKEWRDGNAPHTDAENWQHGFACDFVATWGYAMHPALATRNGEYQQHAMGWFKEAVQDIHATLTKKA